MKKTSKIKKQTIIGTQTYINRDTGEIEDFLVVNKEIEQDHNFHKIWINDLLVVLDLLGGRKIDVLNHILKNMRNEDNTVSLTYRDIAKELQISQRTIAQTMKILKEANFISKIKNGLWMINPDVLIRGKTKKRRGLLVKYIENKTKNNKQEDKTNEKQ